MKFFPVMEGFLLDESVRGTSYIKRPDGTFPRAQGISYLNRYDFMCKRLMLKSLYTSVAVVAVPPGKSKAGEYEDVSAETNIYTFMLKLANHCELVASIEKQKTESTQKANG